MNTFAVSAFTAAAGVALMLTGCGGSNGSSAEIEAESPTGPPTVAGVSPQKVQSELDGLDCVTTRDLLSSADMTEDLYFGTMANYASGQGGSADEWRAAIDWWWQTACGGM